MVRLILTLTLCWAGMARAQLFRNKLEQYKSKLPDLVEKLRSIDMKAHPTYEEAFNASIRGIENATEEEKLFCAGEAPDKEGWVVPSDQRQLCFRLLKNHYLDSMETVFDLKKKYLEVLHSKQVEKLTEIQKKLRTDIEKNF